MYTNLSKLYIILFDFICFESYCLPKGRHSEGPHEIRLICAQNYSSRWCFPEPPRSPFGRLAPLEAMLFHVTLVLLVCYIYLPKCQMSSGPWEHKFSYPHKNYLFTFQFGSFVGMVAGPVIGFVTKKPIVSTMVRYGINGAAVGVVTGPVLTEGRLMAAKATPESVWDRSYRLRYNARQVRMDRFASFCALGGTTVTTLMGKGPLPGAVIGLVTGTVVGIVVAYRLSPSTASKPKPKADKVEEKKE